MPKGFSSQICIYCQKENSTPTGDHIISRSFFTLNNRDNIPKVPACTSCNNKKSKLEHYLATILPFGGKHTEASNYLKELVPARLTKNQKLHRNLKKEIKKVLGV
ncbi:MAG: HNH endonuclease [Kordiimonadaceae bacterium]|nr:HNH endonuclease [Kordiimonadaceae bacterium]